MIESVGALRAIGTNRMNSGLLAIGSRPIDVKASRRSPVEPPPPAASSAARDTQTLPTVPPLQYWAQFQQMGNPISAAYLPYPTPPEPDTAPESIDASPLPVDQRPDLADVEAQYQVEEDETVDYAPRVIGIPLQDPIVLTRTEAELLDRLQAQRGLLGLNAFKDIKEEAFAVAEEHFADGSHNGHQDAFRHTYWNARLTQEFGAEWAEQFTTAHEGVADTPSAEEAMDLYNNEVGRQIAIDNPDASPEEIAGLVQQAADNGELLVIDGDGNLAWSDQVSPGHTGNAAGEPGHPVIDTPTGDAVADPY